MDKGFAQQIKVENQMLKGLIEGIRSTVAWIAKGDVATRSLSTLRFIVHSFRGHLERIFALEELGGYMEFVPRKAPRLSRTVDALRMEHDDFRSGIRRIVHGLEHVSSNDQAKLTVLGDELLRLLEKLEEHNRKEADLYQEAFEQDRGGGEG